MLFISTVTLSLCLKIKPKFPSLLRGSRKEVINCWSSFKTKFSSFITGPTRDKAVITGGLLDHLGVPSLVSLACPGLDWSQFYHIVAISVPGPQVQIQLLLESPNL